MNSSMSDSSAPRGVLYVQPLALQVMGVGAMAGPATVVGGGGTSQLALLRPPLDTVFNLAGDSVTDWHNHISLH